ncbi:uncharacterized protein EV420DRAFT_1757973 [Desarmillaria tabescens]|uniref:Uncharacterized protein n=1 Tax=Armillaria tabescens TaxID=1929756 RepID=A0AA39U9E4_ARMTA|nr:uncharacterized protein EV420DRAFT_1757973 [Desarmillaria tabescens]KAK0470475.1 hypothetical protein EV420DRAFT_1757973 [Desarmillaria tabescens]
MSPVDIFSCLNSLEYVPTGLAHPAELASAGNGFSWSEIQEQAPYFDNNECPQSSTPSSTPDATAQYDFGSLFNLQTSDLPFTVPDASRSVDPLCFLFNDASFDGLRWKKDATNTGRRYSSESLDLLDNAEIGDNASGQNLDNGLDFGLLGDDYNSRAVSTNAASVSPNAIISTTTQHSTLSYSDEPLNSSSASASPSDPFYLVNSSDGYTGTSYSNYPPRGNCPSFEYVSLFSILFSIEQSRHTIFPTNPSIITFDSLGSTQRDADAIFTRQSTARSAPEPFVPSYARGYGVASTSYYTMIRDGCPVASPSQGSSYKTFEQEQVLDQSPVFHDAKYNSLGRVGSSPTKDSKKPAGASKNTVKKPYNRTAPGPKWSSRVISPPSSLAEVLANGRNEYVLLKDFQINALLKVYNVPSEEVPEVFYALQRIHSPDILYTCPMKSCEAELTLDEIEDHCLAHHSTISCDSSCPSRGDKSSVNHTSLCRLFVTCDAHGYHSTFTATEARGHCEEEHLYPHGMQCPNCGNLYPELKHLYKHMSRKACEGLEKWRIKAQ